jgi:hypothetical protein
LGFGFFDAERADHAAQRNLFHEIFSDDCDLGGLFGVVGLNDSVSDWRHFSDREAVSDIFY